MILLLVLCLAHGDITKIAVGSCYGQFNMKNTEILTSITNWKPDLYIWLGDAVYADLISYADKLEISNYQQWKKAFADFKSTPEYSLLLNTTKITGIWDDHDYGLNNADSSFFMKHVSQEIYMDFIGEKINHTGIYREFYIDPRINIIMLDVRYFRENNNLLGEEQWEWLEKQLKNNKTLNFIITGMQVNVEDRYSLTERWDNTSRVRLLNLIKDIPGVFIVSGDIHFGEIMINNCLEYPLYELTASGMTHTEATLYGILAYWYLFNCNAMSYHEYGRILIKHFGTIEIDWDKKTVVLSIQDTWGKIIIQKTVLFSDFYKKSTKSKLCEQLPLERHLKHISSCFIIFHLPVILHIFSFICFLRKYSHSTYNK